MLAFGLGLMATGASAAENPVGKLVAEVIPLDLKSVDPNYVKSLMHTRPDKPYDDSVINEDVRRLLNTHLFVPGSVSVSTAISADGRVTVFVKARELTGVAQEVLYFGAQHLSQSELQDLTQIRKGGPMNPGTNELGKQAILNKLREDGRYYASVQLTEGNSINDTRVVYQIVEGPIVRVKAIEFRGNQIAATGRLKTQTVTGTPLFPRIVTALSPKFTPGSMEEDKKKIIDYYHKLGHLDAMVNEEIVPGTNDISEVTLVYHVHEGRPYTVRNVRIDGNKMFTEDRLRKVTDLKPGKTFDSDIVQADEKRIEMLCGNGGLKTFVQTEKYVVPNQPGVVDVHYHVVEQNREPYRIGNIIIEGNTITDQRVILNQLGFFPGQILQYPKLEEAQYNLMRLGIFDQEDPPKVDVIQDEANGDFKDIRVRVKETRTGMVALQANVNSDAGVNGSLTLNQRNFDILRVPTSLDDLFSGKAFRGGGQELKIEAMPGTIFQRYAITFREPYLFDSKFGFTGSGYYYNRQFVEYNEARVGARAAFDYRFTDNQFWRATLTTRIEDVNITQAPYWAPPAITNDVGHSTVLGLRAGMTRDTRDSYLMPTSGSVVDFGVEQVLGDYQFPIGTVEASKFFTIWQRKDGSGKHVLAARTQVTVMGGNAPVFERVYAGGIRSFRGFSFRGVGPNENQLNVGGTFAFLNNIEYQVPILANDKLYFASFIDHGTVERGFGIKDYRVAVGVGLRIVVPALGPLPIALDFAVPLTRSPYDSKQLFSFYMGWGIGQ